MELSITDKLAALSHPQRLAVFRLLVRRCPDALPAGEIARVLKFKASTASVYLSALTRVGLIAQLRQGTSLLYSLNADAARMLVSDLFLDCCRGRPDLCPPLPEPTPKEDQPNLHRKSSVLFIGTSNTTRSIFAEAILRHEAGDRFTVCSAGTQPGTQVDPAAIRILSGHDLPTDDLHSKSIAKFQPPDVLPLDFVFTVCDHAANEDYPIWPGQPISAHWGLPDPARTETSEPEQRRAYQEVFALMHERITAFAALPLHDLDRITLQHQVDDIGRQKETA